MRKKNIRQRLKVEDWGLIPYEEAWKRQTEIFNAIIRSKTSGGEPCENRLVFCEHPHVFTLGRNGNANNLLITDAQLNMIGASLKRIDRGGDITYHGPGQLVCYPLIDMEAFSLGVKEYVHLLEEAVIEVCHSYGIEAGRLKNATGVWVENYTPRARKICSIGIHCSRYVTMHGLALNVSTDLCYFDCINPCGFTDRGTTSIEFETGHEVPLKEVQKRLEERLKELLEKSIKRYSW